MAEEVKGETRSKRQRSSKSRTSVGLDKAPILYKKITLAQAKSQGRQLADFAKANNLSVDIAGKQYMQVEGWQFVGTLNGLTDIVKSCFRITEAEQLQPNEIKYRAEVEIINQNGTVISRGIAYASNKEKKKTSFEEYAVASMAQTRAIGKAYRNFLAWIIKMAGYEPTPVEEIDRDAMEADLSKTKQKVMEALMSNGITDATEMLDYIESITGKRVINTIEEANMILAALNE